MRNTDTAERRLDGAIGEIQILIQGLMDADRLTGLPGKRPFRRELSPPDLPVVAAAAIEIDGFKNINSRYGHDGGDEVLCEVARRLEEFAQDGSAVSAYHLSGDEFALLMRGPSRDRARDTAVRAKQCVEGRPYILDEVEQIPADGVTVSVAVAHIEAGAGPDAREDVWRDLDALVEYQKWTGQSGEVMALWAEGAAEDFARFRQMIEGATRQRVMCDECGCFGYINIAPGFRGCRMRCDLFADVPTPS